MSEFSTTLPEAGVYQKSEMKSFPMGEFYTQPRSGRVSHSAHSQNMYPIMCSTKKTRFPETTCSSKNTFFRDMNIGYYNSPPTDAKGLASEDITGEN